MKGVCSVRGVKNEHFIVLNISSYIVHGLRKLRGGHTNLGAYGQARPLGTFFGTSQNTLGRCAVCLRHETALE